MSSLRDRKYKDDLPLNTVNKIRKILSDLGITTIETDWKNSAKGFCSVRVQIANTSIATNGKGTSHEYALASAYAELMERIQNQTFFRLNDTLSESAMSYKDFYYAPDEEYLSVDDFIKRNDEWCLYQLSKISSKKDKYELLNKWAKTSYEHTPLDFVSIPYKNLNTNKLSYIPVNMVSKIYMSNGMCAGNTFEEALIQGISEVLERHVNQVIIKEKITPPDIPRTYIQKFPKLDSMITQIESKGNYKVVIKDCSLNENYPVLAAIFINKDNQNYFIKFGSHPVFEISLERTLTELLQGQDISNMMGLKEYSHKSNVSDEYQNLLGILVNGSGYYPSEFFSSNSDYDFNEFEDTSDLDNKEMLNHVTKLLNDKGFNIFVRDCSFLDFPSYHVIVPGLSEVDKFDDTDSLDYYIKFIQIKKHIKNLRNLSNQEITDLIDLINEVGYSPNASVTQILNLDNDNNIPWYYSNMELFLSALNYNQKYFEKSYNHFNKYLKSLNPKYCNKNIINHYKCVRDYISMRDDNIDDENIEKNLKLFYNNNSVNSVISEFKYPENILNINYIDEYNYRNEKISSNPNDIIYKSLKDRYILSNVNQKSLSLD
ncbi:YcaO-like family protein [Tepidibacter aestuarii]|uniref:YcaO-like family protein n=1 Tax=Tepidibacter aestuarii TaxID=2925782 RepID=UPI0020BF2082|nr:YcaO-like family protein [Tepidibacter aestuarii]CAH2214972.1 ribosomal protein S12 methylthiotransferase accessory factor [Tepidibacter aestuarii]